MQESIEKEGIVRNSDLLERIIGSSEKVKLTMTSDHFKYQEGSLRLCYQPNAVVELRQENPFRFFSGGGTDQARDAFCLWVYQTRPHKGELKISFRKEGKSCCWFSFGLDFNGWRTAWLIYERDMIGRPEEGMDTLRIEFPEEEGCLYLSDVQLAAKIDPRHPTPDRQVRQVNPSIGASGHWMKLLHFEEYRKKLQEDAVEENLICQKGSIKNTTAVILQRQKTYLLEKYAERQSRLSFEKICEGFDKYDWRERNGILTGRSIDSVYTLEILPEEKRRELKEQGVSIDMRETAELLLDMALYFVREGREEAAERYVTLIEHLWDQGLAYGSSLGTTHHYGYVLKELFDSIFLMSDYLGAKKARLLEDLKEMTVWMTGLGRVYCLNEESSINIDVLNTYSHAMLMTILLENEELYRCKLLTEFASWLNQSIEYAKGLEGIFKPDGSMFHHCSHYPAYGLDGLKSLTPLIYFLAGTLAEISPRAYGIVENALEKMRWYCNLKHWPTALSARHPKTDGEHTHLTGEVFYYMALAEEASGKGKKMGNIYLRLEGTLSESLEFSKPELTQRRIAELAAKGCRAEQTPNGHLTMNWACASFHRRGEWLAAIRGHNRYLWSHESYVANNLYGRYISYGHLQILSQGHPITLKSNGYQAEGFDWNSFSGTTAVELPFAELRSKVYNVDEFSGYEEMLLTDEAFAGGLSLGENGIFAMKLHGHAKYDESHRANLSSFFFGNTILRLASDISGKDEEHRTITTLFQSLLSEGTASIFVNKRQIKVLEYFCEKHRNGMVLADAYRNSYFIPKKAKIEVRCSFQTTPTQNTGKAASGYFAKALIDHGKAPKKEDYEYIIGVDTDPMDFFEETRKWKKEPFYRVHQKNAQAHIVEHFSEKTFSYVLFGAYHKKLRKENDILCSASRACLCMIAREAGGGVRLSFCDPDLRLYEGMDEEQYDEQGRQLERSVYSRPWIHNMSIGKETKIVLKGLFAPAEDWQGSKECTSLLAISRDTESEETILTFWGIGGGSVELILKKAVGKTTGNIGKGK